MALDRPLAEQIAPDSIRQLQRAARLRFAEAACLEAEDRLLGALYLYGYTVEMCLCAASFRSAGFRPNARIDRDVLRHHMAHARHLRTSGGKQLMEDDPHPLVGWARLLQWRRSAHPGLSSRDANLLKEAVSAAERAYEHWRPELRYKTTDVTIRQLREVREAASWLLANQDHL